jgi:peptidyl-prolyl cis-trans isomerase-like 2
MYASMNRFLALKTFSLLQFIQIFRNGGSVIRVGMPSPELRSQQTTPPLLPLINWRHTHCEIQHKNMVKRQKEKQYQSARENRANQLLRSSSSSGNNITSTGSRGLLPFSHCALTLVPFETPVCNAAGIIFDNAALVKFILRHKVDPVTGIPVDSSKCLIRLHMDQNEEGEWQCPILTKPFTDRSKVIAIIQPGERNEANVYSYEAYYELNIKARNFEDLQTGNKFDKDKDVLTIYDPSNDDLNCLRDINSFYHIQHARELLDINEESSDQIRHSVTATRVMETFRKNQAKNIEQQIATEKKRKAESMLETKLNTLKYYKDGIELRVLAEDVTGAKYTEGRGGAATSLTSTVTTVSDQNVMRVATDDEILFALCNVMRNKVKKKGYVRMKTNYGNLTLELHCDIVPRTCMNFLELCKLGKYNNSSFHRLIPNFMIQGGKPSNVEDKEECIWGGSFVDEFDDRLKHEGSGILSMANSGQDTNRQQFFLTLKSCPHLDRKHSIFGTVVDGTEILVEMEHVAIDKKNRPCEEIKIISTDVLIDPVKEARELEQARLEKVMAMREQPTTEHQQHIDGETKLTRLALATVGRYLQQSPKLPSGKVKQRDSVDEPSVIARLPPPPKKTAFGNFSDW